MPNEPYFGSIMVRTFSNISALSWRSVLLAEETGGLRENYRPVASHRQTLSPSILYTSPWSRFELTTSVVTGTDCIGSCKSNYHTIMATTAQFNYVDISIHANHTLNKYAFTKVWIICCSKKYTVGLWDQFEFCKKKLWFTWFYIINIYW